VERSFALALLVLSAPLLLAIALIVWASDGRPILYSGVRLGRKRRPFTMFKFRTLRVGAQRVTGSRLLDHSHDLAIRGGKFLRDTRLDELPQLWNVLRGEMSLVGPRPERPEVYRAECREIAGYERRFETRPGLIGPCQLHTPHGTDKRYRTRIDNTHVRHRGGRASGLRLVPYTALVVLRTTIRRVAEHLRPDVVQRRLLGRHPEKRKLRRVRLSTAFAHVFPQADMLPRRFQFRVLDMNENAFLVRCDEELPEGRTLEVRLELFLYRKDGSQRTCSARCQAFATHRRKRGEGHVVVLQYRPSTPRSAYMIHQYFLGTSLAPPPCRQRFVAGKPPAAGRRLHRLSAAFLV